MIIRKNKKSKDGRVSSPEYFIESQPRSNHDAVNDFAKQNLNINNGSGPRPVSMIEVLPKDDNRYFQADKLQQEIVQAKIQEMNKKKDAKKRNKNDTKTTEKLSRDLPSKSGERNVHKSGYNTWNAHNASNMREKSKQFFTNDGGEEGGARSSARSLSFQRQSSLPPRPKKESMEIHRVLPRAPSGPMYKSPEQKHRIANRADRSESQNSASAPTSKINTPIKSNLENKSSPARPPKHTTGNSEEKTYSTLSDITKHGGSVKISHKAEI